MNALKTLTIETGGKVTLPDAARARYGMNEATRIRIIETQNGLLLVPLTDEPMSAGLAAELAEWQELGAESWEVFPCQEN